MKTSFKLSTKTIARTDVLANVPDSYAWIVKVPVQSGFTTHDPVSVSLAKPPPTFLASVAPDVIFPWASKVPLATPAAGTRPVGRISVPVRVTPQLPATLSVEQPLGESAWTTGNKGVLLCTVVLHTTRLTHATEAANTARFLFIMSS